LNRQQTTRSGQILKKFQKFGNYPKTVKLKKLVAKAPRVISIYIYFPLLK
jgi:hypothetical protein